MLHLLHLTICAILRLSSNAHSLETSFLKENTLQFLQKKNTPLKLLS